ncbi:MAG: hypothetical protein LBU51_01495 [Bacteroidales bacterium]|jgi:hypothetical protein|nr:hypothetical protein [Bacteroidales bacterium]
MKKTTVLMTIVLMTTMLTAQVDTARFRLEYNAKLENIQKINQQAQFTDTNTSNIDFEYFITPLQPDLTFNLSRIAPAKLTSDPMKRLYRDFLKLGFGYPVSPLVELCVHNPDNRKYSYGLNVYHLSNWSPQVGKMMNNYAYAPSSDTRALVFFNSFFKNQTLYSSIGYNHELATFYGFNRDSLSYLPDIDYFRSKEYRDSLNNSFHHVKAELGIRSNYLQDDRKLKQDVRLNYDMIYTHQRDIENHVALKSFFGYDARFMKISGSQNYRIDFNVDFWNNSFNALDTLNNRRQNYSLAVEFKPTMNFTIKEYHLLLGIGMPIIYNLETAKTSVPLYPVAELQLGIVPGILSLYAGVDGKTSFNSLQQLIYENPFLKPNIDSLRFTKCQISVYGGVKGNLVKKLNYHLSARFSNVKNQHFFMLDTASYLKNQFTVIYKNVQILNVNLNLNWQVLSHLFLNFDANYWGYFNFDRKDDVAWYSPNLTFAFNGKYILKEKYVFDLNFDLQFGRKGLVPGSEAGQYWVKTLAPILNFGVGFEYLINKRFSAFATASNIAFQRYSQYSDFKAFGLHAIAGITYSFGDENISKK